MLAADSIPSFPVMLLRTRNVFEVLITQDIAVSEDRGLHPNAAVFTISRHNTWTSLLQVTNGSAPEGLVPASVPCHLNWMLYQAHGLVLWAPLTLCFHAAWLQCPSCHCRLDACTDLQHLPVTPSTRVKNLPSQHYKAPASAPAKISWGRSSRHWPPALVVLLTSAFFFNIPPCRPWASSLASYHPLSYYHLLLALEIQLWKYIEVV